MVDFTTLHPFDFDRNLINFLSITLLWQHYFLVLLLCNTDYTHTYDALKFFSSSLSTLSSTSGGEYCVHVTVFDYFFSPSLSTLSSTSVGK